MERIVQARGDKVFIDTGQTGVSRAIVAPLAVRATPLATVSMPIEWDEVTDALDPSVFTLRSAPERLRALGDPMQPLLTTPVDLRGALDRLAGVAALRG
jgi:bifunctional non-homologous end joining protein LigD